MVGLNELFSGRLKEAVLDNIRGQLEAVARKALLSELKKRGIGESDALRERVTRSLSLFEGGRRVGSLRGHKTKNGLSLDISGLRAKNRKDNIDWNEIQKAVEKAVRDHLRKIMRK